MISFTSLVVSFNEDGKETEAMEARPVFISQTIEIPADAIDIGYNGIDILFQESGKSILYVFVNDEGDLDYEFTDSVDGGRNEIVELWNGWRVYPSSDAIAGALIAGDVVIHLLNLFPGLGTGASVALAIVGAALIATSLTLYGVNLSNPGGYNGLFFDVTYEEGLKIWGVTISPPARDY